MSYNWQSIVADLPLIRRNMEDKVVWTLHANGEYTSRSAKEALRDHKEVVSWWKVVWFKGHVPRRAVIMWMACKGKLLTRDGLKNWGCIVDDRCVLCGEDTETMQHLFFQCSFAQRVWRVAKQRSGINRTANTWEDVIRGAVRENTGKSFNACLKNLTLAACVYFIWQERYHRIFKDIRHDWAFVLAKINENVREATWKWRARRDYTNWTLCKEWGLYDPIILDPLQKIIIIIIQCS